MGKLAENLDAYAGEALAATDAVEATARFFAALAPVGATYLQTRIYRRPSVPLTATTHWDAGGFVARHARPGWSDTASFRYICFECNPLIQPIREGQTRYRFSDFAPHASKAFGAYWEALGDGGMAEALCATSYGTEGKIASLHLGTARRTFAPGEAETIQLAGLLLTEHLMDLAEPAIDKRPVLTARERDALAFVAGGKTDWEISIILGVSESTARFHVDNARKKLGAVNRAHAIARGMAQRRF